MKTFFLKVKKNQFLFGMKSSSVINPDDDSRQSSGWDFAIERLTKHLVLMAISRSCD